MALRPGEPAAVAFSAVAAFFAVNFLVDFPNPAKPEPKGRVVRQKEA